MLKATIVAHSLRARRDLTVNVTKTIGRQAILCDRINHLKNVNTFLEYVR